MKAEMVAAGNGCEAGWRDGRRYVVDAKVSASQTHLRHPVAGGLCRHVAVGAALSMQARR